VQRGSVVPHQLREQYGGRDENRSCDRLLVPHRSKQSHVSSSRLTVALLRHGCSCLSIMSASAIRDTSTAPPTPSIHPVHGTTPQFSHVIGATTERPSDVRRERCWSIQIPRCFQPSFPLLEAFAHCIYFLALITPMHPRCRIATHAAPRGPSDSNRPTAVDISGKRSREDR
jgi:hypothetical protein